MDSKINNPKETATPAEEKDTFFESIDKARALIAKYQMGFIRKSKHQASKVPKAKKREYNRRKNRLARAARKRQRRAERGL